MRVVGREPVPGGFMVTVEVPGAYTDGSSRLDRVFVHADAVRGRTVEQVRQAVKDALDDDPLGAILGEDVVVPTQTKTVVEDQMVLLYGAWRRWQATRVEAQARGLAGAVIAALQAKEDAAWFAYGSAITEWRKAPEG